MEHLPLTLLGAQHPEVSDHWTAQRFTLDPCCWVDHATQFVVGADALLCELDQVMQWTRGRRLMYGTWHEEPRRTGILPLPHQTVPPVIASVRRVLSSHYDRAFDGLFCNYYERGSDSVAWHADRIGRTEVDPLVAIVSLGGPRTFHLRPQQGGAGHRVVLHSGDLLVMGGATQHHWEHSIPKVRQANPRMSVTMRAGGPPLSTIPAVRTVQACRVRGQR